MNHDDFSNQARQAMQKTRPAYESKEKVNERKQYFLRCFLFIHSFFSPEKSQKSQKYSRIEINKKLMQVDEKTTFGYAKRVATMQTVLFRI